MAALRGSPGDSEEGGSARSPGEGEDASPPPPAREAATRRLARAAAAGTLPVAVIPTSALAAGSEVRVAVMTQLRTPLPTTRRAMRFFGAPSAAGGGDAAVTSPGRAAEGVDTTAPPPATADAPLSGSQSARDPLPATYFQDAAVAAGGPAGAGPPPPPVPPRVLGGAAAASHAATVATSAAFARPASGRRWRTLEVAVPAPTAATPAAAAVAAAKPDSFM